MRIRHSVRCRAKNGRQRDSVRRWLRFLKRQVHGHRRVVGDAVGNGFVELAHGHREVRREPKILRFAARVRDKRLHEDPVELEAADEPAKVAGKSVRGNKSLCGALIAVGQSSRSLRNCALRLASEIESALVREAKILDSFEKRPFAIVPQHRQVQRSRIVVAVEVAQRNSAYL